MSKIISIIFYRGIEIKKGAAFNAPPYRPKPCKGNFLYDN